MELGVIKSQLHYYLKQAGDLLWVKLAIGTICAALLPHQHAIQGLALLSFIDLVCGVWVAVKTHTLSSAGMRRGIAKVLIYSLFITAVALCEGTILHTEFCTVGAIGLLAATELLSITENLVMLGLPVPYGAKVLRVVSKKAKNFGFNINADDIDGLTYAKDMVDMIRVHVPALRNAELRGMLTTYCSGWYAFIRDLNEQPFMGDNELAWERIRTSIERNLVDINNQWTRDEIEPALQRTFTGWTTNLMAAFMRQVRTVCLSTEIPYRDKPERVRELLALMLYRLLSDVTALDSANLDPLHAQHRAPPAGPDASLDEHHRPAEPTATNPVAPPKKRRNKRLPPP